ncbi:MAG: DUF4230 domain-containing protein [Anaerolineales bacterium]|nr:DUF4230 domain-containing protein [Anaerolineales bacterium]
MKNIIVVFLIGVLVFLLLAGALLFMGYQAVAEPLMQMGGALRTEIASVLHPTATILPDPVTIVREVRSLARLETIQYTIEKVITAETGQGPFGFLFGDRLLLVAHGVVIAGIDLNKLEPADIQFDDLGRIYIALPEAEVFIVALDNEQSYVYDRDTGLLTSGNVELESEARRAAEDEIRAAALEDGILDQATVNAEHYLFGLLRSLGYSDVFFNQDPAGIPFEMEAAGTQVP